MVRYRRTAQARELARRHKTEGRRQAAQALLAQAVLFPLLSSTLRQSENLALAQLGGPYTLDWSTVDGGGYTFSAGGSTSTMLSASYELGGTIGQPDAGTLSGGEYTLAGGFWGGGVVGYKLRLPLMLKDYP